MKQKLRHPIIKGSQEKEVDKLSTMYGFPREGNWYKGNLHSHTTVSDGTYTPEQAVKEFKKRGYSFLCISDHNIYSDYRGSLEEKEFLLLPGVEAAAVLFDENDQCRKVHHINAILGTKQMEKQAVEKYKHMEKVEPLLYYGSWNGVEVADRMLNEFRKRGCFTTYNHPIWSRVGAEELIHTEGLEILEIFNYNTENESGTGYDTTYWDAMLRQGKHVMAAASDDNHNGGVFDDAFGGYIMVKASALTQDAIAGAILAGDYYSSSGPSLYEWGVKENTVYLKCSGAERITFIADGFVGAGATFIARSRENLLLEATYALTGKETYVRAECTDLYGKKAWTNPVYLN